MNPLISQLNLTELSTSNIVQICSTLLLATTAFTAPYVLERWKIKYKSPELKIKFKLSPPYCHITQMGGNEGFPVYYFRFIVENTGKTQAEDCEVFIEKIFKENSAGEMIKYQNFSPVNLKWSGIREPFKRTIQPGRKMFCDIGRIQHPDYKYESVYRKATKKDQDSNKFIFELPERYYSQWDCLTHGKYKIIISIYSKNASKITKDFLISWTGKWENEDSNMFNELVIR